MELKPLALAALLACTTVANAQQTHSTVNPNIPVAGQPVEQGGPALRQNFLATFNDINTLFGQTSTLNVPYTFTANSASSPGVLPTGTLVHLVANNGAASILTIDGFAAPTAILGRRTQGTAASPTGVVTDNALLLVNGVGWTSAGAYGAASPSMVLAAAETWSGSAQGSYIRFLTTPSGTATPVETQRLWGSGGVSIGGVFDPGKGNLVLIGGTATGPVLNIAPQASSLSSGLLISHSIAGNSGFPAGNALNLLQITSDNAVLTGANFLQVFQVNVVCCSSLAQGGRNGLSSFMTINGADAPTNANKNWLAGIYSASASVNVGGTDVIAPGSNARGNLFAANPYAFLVSGATNWTEVAGEEINVAVHAGASVFRKSLLHLAYFCPNGICDSVQGTVDGAILISSASGLTTAKNIILVNNTDGFVPIGAGTTIFNVSNGGGITPTTGIDFSSLAGFSSCAFKSPGSFCISGTGGITATLPTSAGAGGIFVCVDSAGVFYKKATCP